MFRCRFCLAPVFLMVLGFAPTCAQDQERSDSLRPGPLRSVVEQLFGQPVLVYAGEHEMALRAAARRALELINSEGISPRRVNEVGNAVEPLVIAALQSEGFSADIPMTASGRRQSAGYPDVVARHGDDLFYIEIKTYNPANQNTTQRSFYLSPSADPKVTAPAFHLIFAFAIERDPDGRYFARSARVLDIAELPVDLKLEFNASNRELYSGELELFSIP